MEKELEAIQFRFANILIISKSVNELTVIPQGNDIRNLNINFTIDVENKVQVNINTIIVNVHVTIQNIETSEKLAEFNISHFFEIIDFDKHIKLNEEGLFVIPQYLENIIKPVSISTARGIIYSELRGGYYGESEPPNMIKLSHLIRAYLKDLS